MNCTIWHEYQSKWSKAQTNDLITKYIVIELGKCLVDFFRKGKKASERTKIVKKALVHLGDECRLGKERFRVYANGLPKNLKLSDGTTFINKEWLYDLHWYQDLKNSDYMPTNVPLVAEIEWRHKRADEKKVVPHSGIKFDFQKLLLANAQLRLMIFLKRPKDKLSDFLEYFEKSIDNYKHLAPNSRFLFIAFDQKIKGFHYIERCK